MSQSQLGNYTVSQKHPTLGLLWLWHTRTDCDNFW